MGSAHIRLFKQQTAPWYFQRQQLVQRLVLSKQTLLALSTKLEHTVLGMTALVGGRLLAGLLTSSEELRPTVYDGQRDKPVHLMLQYSCNESPSVLPLYL